MLFQSPIYSKASGSQGGTTFSHNRYGMYTRSRSMPVNPSSPRQEEHRARLQFLTERWRSYITQNQRDAWDVYGDNVVMKNSIGEDVYLPGFNHYLRSNLARMAAGQVDISNAPDIFTLPDADTSIVASYSSATQNCTLSFNNALDWAHEHNGMLTVFMSQPTNPYRNFVGGPFRHMGVVEGSAVATPSSPQVFPAPFPFANNQRVSTKLRIGRGDARLSEPFRFTSASSA